MTLNFQILEIMKKVFLIAGARPNFMKIAPIWHEIQRHNAKNPEKPINAVIVHTGQHYDVNMSGSFFHDLELPAPDIYLGVGSASHAVQTAKIIVEFEKVCLERNPDLVIVVGDVNSTLACSITASKLLIPVAHVEAGLRSFDRTMPEEINRIVTDALSNFLFTTCRDANENLRREGIDKGKIFFVGNVMIDSLKKFSERIPLGKVKSEKLRILEKLGLKKQGYALLTLHRPSNVDDKDSFERILKALREISKRLSVFFPAHPRTKKQIELFKLQSYFSDSGIKVTDPVGYLDFLNLMINSKFVLTDSGGIQEETTALNIPCLTLRRNTERPITVSQGTNTIVGDDTAKIIREANKIIDGSYKQGNTPELWDGKAAKRIVQVLREKL